MELIDNYVYADEHKHLILRHVYLLYINLKCIYISLKFSHQTMYLTVFEKLNVIYKDIRFEQSPILECIFKAH